MNAGAVRRLKWKIIMTSTLTFFLVMLVLGASINTANALVTNMSIHRMLDYLVDHNGEPFPYTNQGRQERTHSGTDEKFEDFSPEFRYSARYFAVIFEPDRETVQDMHTGHVSQLTEEDAEKMARWAVGREKSGYGKTGYYYWRTAELEDGRWIAAFLNCQSQISANRRVIFLTLVMAFGCLAIAFILVVLFSNRIIRPEIENIRRQKQFVTNASHELKTPLAVIRANTEIEEMMNGESEWTQSTMRQVDRLNGLVQNLVMIARAQEQEDRSVMEPIDISRCVAETVSPYESLAQQDKKELVRNITPDIRMLADESKIRQLTSLLIDNAFKYCDPEGKVIVQLDTLRKGRQVRLSISNTYAAGANVDYSRFFERFYREDRAHNVDRGGFGIGLSIAESICRQYGGTISVSWKDGMIVFTCVLV
ncbi:MAG: HAMP domain-containing histidine kinase [Lachnospiraceae bacterium]|nr:HAMP domain-containing histidine kinase [Lachnospiraceae bacterium]